MAESSSAEKRHRQSLKRRERNRAVRSLTRTALRKALVALETEPASAQEALRQAASVLDRAARKGVLHPNQVARRKSRLMARYKAALAVASEPAAEAAPKAAPKRKRAAPKAKAKAKAEAVAAQPAAAEKKPRVRARLPLGRRKKTDEK